MREPIGISAVTSVVEPNGDGSVKSEENSNEEDASISPSSNPVQENGQQH